MTSQGARIHFFPSQLYAVVISYTCTCSASPDCQPPFSFTYYCLSTLTLVLPYILARLLHLSPRKHRYPIAQLTTESNISCSPSYCYFVSPHDGENTMRFERASQTLANQDLPRSYGVGMIVCMYSPSAHRLTFRELCVCNGDWRGERDAGVDIARRTLREGHRVCEARARW